MNIGRRRTVKMGIYPVLVVDIDGQEARFGLDVKRTLLDEYGIVYLGQDFEDKHSYTLPVDEDAGQYADELPGFTDDTAVVGIVRDWLDRQGRL